MVFFFSVISGVISQRKFQTFLLLMSHLVIKLLESVELSYAGELQKKLQDFYHPVSSGPFLFRFVTLFHVKLVLFVWILISVWRFSQRWNTG